MKHIKKLFIVILLSIFVYKSAKSMKRRPEIDLYLLQAVTEAIHRENVNIWHENISTVMSKERKTESALTQMETPKIIEPTIIPHKKIPPVRITFPQRVIPTPLKIMPSAQKKHNQKKYYCTLCNISFATERNQERHYNSQKHHQVLMKNPEKFQDFF
ncbi:MAG TPA: C2H2-type zinc finger protein [Candidatus Babeliales bacterium]|jgi:hypothetical protein|nr:C2H2-type zinc finger protein [Candidatus Babeliales bacterium]